MMKVKIIEHQQVAWGLWYQPAGSDWSSFCFVREFISRSVHTGLQVSTCSSYDVYHPG